VDLINERGQITGTSGKHAFIWKNGKMLDLGTLGGKVSNAVAINERGQVIGQSTTKSGRSRAFLWQNGKMRDLGVLPGDTDSEAVAINGRGQVVGCSSGEPVFPEFDDTVLPCTRGSAFVWENGKMRDLGALPGDRDVSAVSINDRGWIIGTSSPGTRGGGEQAFLWRSGQMIALGKLGALSSTPIDLNERGQIVVETTEPDRVFLWEDRKTRIIQRGDSHIVGINDRGQIVGSTLSDRVFLWEKGRTRYLGEWSPSVLNERGQIAGMGVRPDHPLLWENGTRFSLPLLPGRETGQAVALNERNQIVGWSGDEEAVPNEMELTVYKGRIVLWTLKRG
jgi:probable HAF family extracellular repeat protein